MLHRTLSVIVTIQSINIMSCKFVSRLHRSATRSVSCRLLNETWHEICLFQQMRRGRQQPMNWTKSWQHNTTSYYLALGAYKFMWVVKAKRALKVSRIASLHVWTSLNQKRKRKKRFRIRSEVNNCANGSQRSHAIYI